MTRTRVALILVLVVGAALRITDAARAPLEGIEEYEFIPTALTLSWEHHPVRVAQHGALPAYIIRASGLVFGSSVFGFRLAAVLAGTATILLLYLLAARGWGPIAGLVAAGLLAVERYHIEVSARAIDLPFDLFFLALSMYAMARFLQADEAGGRASRWLIGSAAAAGFGFLCKEFTGLMIPVIAVTLLISGRAAWFRRPAFWGALATFAVVIAPDVHAGLTITPAERQDLMARHFQVMRQRGIDMPEPEAVPNGFFMSHADQLSRFRSIGFNREPFYFYFGEVFDRMGVVHSNEFDEITYMHPALAIVLWLAVGVALIRRRYDSLRVFLLTMFVVMFVPFATVELGPPRATLATDPQALWYWVDRSMLPAIVLTGYVVATRWNRGRSRGRVAG